MKAILFIDSLTNAGAQRQLVNLAVGLHQAGHQVSVLTYALLEQQKEPLLNLGIAYQCYPKRGRFDLWPAWHLRRLVRQFKADIVIAFLRTPAIYAEMVKLSMPSLPLIVSERAGVESSGLSARDLFAGTGHILASHLTANSHDYVDRLIRKLPPLKKRSTVIYNGIGSVFFEQGAKTMQGGPAPVNRPIRFCVVAARADRQKAPLVLAHALAAFKATAAAPFELDWIGPVDHNSELVRQTQAYLEAEGISGQWHWRGPQPDLWQWYGRYDALVSPSLYEGVANTMCEAMACAVPVVVTDVADNRRIVEDTGAGLVCASGDADALAQALGRFVSLSQTQRQTMGRLAHETASSLFSMQQFVDRWEALCLRILSTKTEQEHVRH